jgi:hypothetical protein
MLILALLLFLLPWVQVRCDRPIGGSDSRVVAEQSGLQAAYGGYTEHQYVAELRSGAEREKLPANLRAQASTVSWAPWVALYAGLLVGGIIAGLAIRRPLLRGAAVIGCCAAAGVALFLQARARFPLERVLPATVTTDVTLGGLKWETSAPTPFETHYMPWFWLSAVVVVGALAAACFEVWLARGLSTPSRKGTAWTV